MSHVDKHDLIETERRLKICVLIPTYNNAGTLRHVVTDVLDYSADVIVINDGSTDNTDEILKEFKDRITVVAYPENRGKGHALKAGFQKAIESGYEYAITIDSDGQHYPEDIPHFVEAIACNYGALIIGERDLSDVDINGKSSFANKFSNFWFHVQTGKRLADTQTGYRAYPLKKLHGLSLLTSRYEAELELLVFAAWNGVSIVPIPIRVYYPPQHERVSHFRPALDFSRISLLNTILCGLAVIYGLPARLYTGFARKRFFSKEFRYFTHKKGERKEAAITLGRLSRSLYGITYYLFWSTCVFTPLAHVYTYIGADTEQKKLRFHKLLQWISRFLTRRFPACRTTIDNPEKESFERPAVIICNHQSHLDLPIMLSISPKLIFLTNDWVWNNAFYGKIIHTAEFLPVSAGLDFILPKLKNLKDRGYSIVVFPEGTRSADCSILRFHQGAFFLARELEVDILPMVLHGAGHYLPKKDFMFRKGEISLSIMPRISSEIYGNLSLREQASYFRKHIRAEYDRIVRKKETDAYFRSLILYKYAYRGWNVVHRCKHTLRQAREYSDIINHGSRYSKVRILNSGIGTFALLFALVNKTVEVYAVESSLHDYRVASGTAGIPRNLHYIHAVWNSEFEMEADLTIILNSRRYAVSDNGTEILLPLKS